MEVIISGRHFEVDDGLKAFTEERVQRLADEYGKLNKVRIVLHQERSWQVAEAHLSGKHLNLDAHVQSRDMAVSVDGVVDKLETQLRRHLEKIQKHRIQRVMEDAPESDETDDLDDEYELELEGELVGE